MKYMQHSRTITIRVARRALEAIIVAGEALSRSPGRGCVTREIIHRRLHSTVCERDPREFQAHLAAGDGREQRQIIAVTDVPDTKHAATHLPETHPERQVEPLEDESSQRVGVRSSR